MTLKKYVLSSLMLFAFSFSSFAHTSGDPKCLSNSKTVEEISSLISSAEWKMDEETTVKVYFLINSSNEIVVVRTDNDGLQDQISDRLNYKKIKELDLDKNSIYILPVRFK